ncbi:MAG: bifunctional ADP-heptose synthase [Bacteroidales bacterium]|nr:bifunctional ADP-heptose synthase [Bacteroidales bacterium]
MDYKDIFQKFNNLNVVVIGDIMVDSYQWGKVERISPEAPVPICAVTKIENRLGGAGNVALNLKAMGANPILCSVIGEDSNGENLLHLMQQEGMTTDYILQSTDRPTTTKTRIIGNNSQMLRIDNESIETLDRKEETAFLKRIESLFSKTKIDVVIFQDYDKGVITERVITTTTSQANKKNIPITVDPKHRNFSLYKDVAMFKPNLKELKEGLKIEFDKPTQENLENASLLLKDKQRIEKVFITLSEYGVFFADYSKKQAEVVLLPANVRKIADVSGAGDTVISVASLCLALAIEPKEIAKISNLAGGLVCEEVGVVPINKDRLYRELLAL